MSKVCQKPVKITFDDNDRNPLRNYTNIGINILEIISSQFYEETKRRLYFNLKSVSKNKGKFNVNYNIRLLGGGESDVFTFGPEDIEIGTAIYPTDSTIIKSSKVPLNDDVKFARPIELDGKRINDVKDLKQMLVDLFNNYNLGFVNFHDHFDFVKHFKYKFRDQDYYLVCYHKETKRYIIIGHEDDPYSTRFKWFAKGLEFNNLELLNVDLIIFNYVYDVVEKNVFEYALDGVRSIPGAYARSRDPVYISYQLNTGIFEECNDKHSMILDIPQEVKDKTLEELERFEKDTKIDVSEFKEAVTKSSNQITFKHANGPRKMTLKSRISDYISMIVIRNSKTVLNRFKFELTPGYKNLICVPFENQQSPKTNTFGYMSLSELTDYFDEMVANYLVDQLKEFQEFIEN